MKNFELNGETIKAESVGKYDFCLDRWEHAWRTVYAAQDGKTRVLRFFKLDGSVEGEVEVPRNYVFYYGNWYEVIRHGGYCTPIETSNNKYVEVVK